MLSDADKDDVASEVERERYRASLAPEKSRAQRFWQFLNTSFGLWLLSAVLLSGLTAGAAKIVESLQARSAAQARRTALHDELLLRYMRMSTAAGGFTNDEQFGLHLQRNEEHYLAIFLRGRRHMPTQVAEGFAGAETADLYLEVERTSPHEDVKRLAQNVWKVAAYADVIARVGKYSDEERRAKHIAAQLSKIRISAGELIYALGYRGSFVPNHEKYEPTFPPKP